jgi:HPt (histidine-containing phosphotransfer) domain-containing protein
MPEAPIQKVVEMNATPTAVFDRAELLERVDGDAELLVEIVRIFLDDLPRASDEMRLASEAGDLKTLARAAHKLRGALANLCAGAAASAARRLEQHAGADDSGKARRELATLMAELGRLKGPLEASGEETVS